MPPVLRSYTPANLSPAEINKALRSADKRKAVKTGVAPSVDPKVQANPQNYVCLFKYTMTPSGTPKWSKSYVTKAAAGLAYQDSNAREAGESEGYTRRVKARYYENFLATPYAVPLNKQRVNKKTGKVSTTQTVGFGLIQRTAAMILSMNTFYSKFGYKSSIKVGRKFNPDYLAILRDINSQVASGNMSSIKPLIRFETARRNDETVNVGCAIGGLLVWFNAADTLNIMDPSSLTDSANSCILYVRKENLTRRSKSGNVESRGRILTLSGRQPSESAPQPTAADVAEILEHAQKRSARMNV